MDSKSEQLNFVIILLCLKDKKNKVFVIQFASRWIKIILKIV